MENLDNFSFLDAKPIQNSFAEQIIQGLKKKIKAYHHHFFTMKKGLIFLIK